MGYELHEIDDELQRVKKRVARLESDRRTILVLVREDINALSAQTGRPYEQCLSALAQTGGDLECAKMVLGQAPG